MPKIETDYILRLLRESGADQAMTNIFLNPENANVDDLKGLLHQFARIIITRGTTDGQINDCGKAVDNAVTVITSILLEKEKH